MLHKISDMTQKVSIMYNKSMVLHRLKYDTPKHAQDELAIRCLVEDIQALAGDIYNDRECYQRQKAEEQALTNAG